MGRRKGAPAQLLPAAPRKLATEEATKSRPWYRPGTRAPRKIQKFQKSTDVAISKSPFRRQVNEMAEDLVPGFLLRSSAVAVLQQASEAYLAEVQEEANVCAAHAKRVTITVKDIRLACRIRGERF
ncbi:hypothetical protein I4F81_012599 [Pyropia yezoensis]|uniref:Uncharacterized protein n=1 Tax=Pyropia yezoensis TaxID=2788 RepID=A0ACC3CIV9_PYRYE|nr:hypothetical protein I4F81_012599 [Neopyropia yezoensis]